MANTPAKLAQCALVLEDSPVGADSRLYFESFPADGIEESYQLVEYRKMGGIRMPQPSFATYQGGDWGPFSLALEFVAGEGPGAKPTAAQVIATEGDQPSPDLEEMLIELEDKVNWCVALGFPLERTNREAGRIVQRARTRNAVPTAASTQLTSKLKRVDPPIVLVVFGSWRVIRCYVMNVSWKWKGPWHPVSARPYAAEVKFAMQPIMTEYPTWQTIRNRAGQFGVTVNGTVTARTRTAAEREAALNRATANRAARAGG